MSIWERLNSLQRSRYESFDRFIDSMFFGYGLDYPTAEELREVIEKCKYYYDEEKQPIWYNEKLFKKHQAYLNSNKGKGTI